MSWFVSQLSLKAKNGLRQISFVFPLKLKPEKRRSRNRQTKKPWFANRHVSGPKKQTTTQSNSSTNSSLTTSNICSRWASCGRNVKHPRLSTGTSHPPLPHLTMCRALRAPVMLPAMGIVRLQLQLQLAGIDSNRSRSGRWASAVRFLASQWPHSALDSTRWPKLTLSLFLSGTRTTRTPSILSHRLLIFAARFSRSVSSLNSKQNVRVGILTFFAPLKLIIYHMLRWI